MKALVFLLVGLALPGWCAAEEIAAAGRIKAAFLYKFAAYVEWPVGMGPDAGPLVIGVAGADAIARELGAAVAGRTVDGRSMLVRPLVPGEPTVGCCHILFIGADTEPERVRRLLEEAQGRPVLTVTDGGPQHPQGSIINFLGVGDRVRFDISRDAAERNGLLLRAQLLAVARQVRGAP